MTLPPAAANLTGFARLVRAMDFAVAPEQTVAFLAAVGLLGPRSMDDVRAAAFATLAPGPDRHEEFEALFRAWFWGDAAVSASGEGDEETQVKDSGGGREEQVLPEETRGGGELASSEEQLAQRRFRQGEASMVRFGEALPAALPKRRSLRDVNTASRGRLDIRRSLRHIVRFDGDIPRPMLRRRQQVERGLLLLIDISGSMRLHTADALGCGACGRSKAPAAEVFTFGTRLTRITSALRIRDRDRRSAARPKPVDDWDGGTRMGPTLLAFLSVPRFAAFARGAAVVLCPTRWSAATMRKWRGVPAAEAPAPSGCRWRRRWPAIRGSGRRTAALARHPALISTTSSTVSEAGASRISSCRLPGPRAGRRHLGEGTVMQKAIDSHFHIWRQKDQPWLVGPMVPRIFGPYEPIRRDYPIEEFLADQKDSGVEKAVYVQTNWAKEDFEKEVAFLQRRRDETGWPHAIVGYADMTVDDVRPQIDRLMKYPLLRGVRMQLHWHETPAFRFAPSADQVIDPKVRANVARLKDYGLSFDLQLFPAQMKDGLTLVGENPETNFILTHCRHADRRDEPATSRPGATACARSRQAPNFYAKLSGLGTFVHRNDPALIAYIVDNAIDNIGQRQPDVRLQLPDREAVDQPCRTDHGTSCRGGKVQPGRPGKYFLADG